MTAHSLIDCAVHPQVAEPDDLRAFMDKPWDARPFPRPERYFYPMLDGEYLPGTGGLGLPGSDASLMAEHLFGRNGVDLAILLPLTRGLLPDIDLGSAICEGTNRWLSERWLGEHNTHGRYRGVIRVCPCDPARAVAEIERWAGDPRFVAIGVPMQSQSPYGQRHFFPIWEAAAAHGLPVMIKLDGGSGVDFAPTAVGYPHHYIEYSVLAPVNFAYHLISFISEGVFERLPDLRVVFSDGGYDMQGPLVWRMDKNWRPTRSETPWMKELPSVYVKRHVRFCSRLLEGPLGGVDAESWFGISQAGDTLLYASGYPYHDTMNPEALDRVPETCRAAVSAGNADRLFRFDAIREAA